MLLKLAKKRWLVAPLAALFLIFSAGAAVAPDCHVTVVNNGKAEQVSADTHSSHAHAHGPTIAPPSNLVAPLITIGGVLNNEVCFIIGFIVLLLLRFARGAKGRFSINAIAPQPGPLPRLISRDLSFLKITHLKLGIIRI